MMPMTMDADDDDDDDDFGYRDGVSSTAEADVISMDAGVRVEGLPALYLWDLDI